MTSIRERPLLWLPAAVAALWLAGWWAWTLIEVPASVAGSKGVHVASGYLDAVDLFIQHGWLEYVPATRTIRLAEDADEGSVGKFYADSFLSRDVEAFNDGDRAVFRVENGTVVAIDPTRHNLVLPFTDVPTWHGALTYRPEATQRGRLAGSGVEIELAGPTVSLREQQLLPEVTVRRKESRQPTQRVAGQAVLVDGEGGVFFGKTHLAGDGVLFNNRDISRGARISISGESVPTGNRSRLDSGDVLKLSWPLPGGSQYALLWTSLLGEARTMSAWRSLNGRWQRIPDEPKPRLAADVVAAVSAALRQQDDRGRLLVPPGGGRSELDLALTLDDEIQQATQERLTAYARRLRGDNETPFRAAVTVMDALTGEILALASYPGEEDIDDDTSGALRRRLLGNHNLSRLPIGSLAKPFFAAAIIDQAPVLATLRIRGYPGGPIDEILGLRLASPLNDHPVGGGEDGWIDFEEFLEKSSNRYAAVLLTLAGAATEAGDGLRPPLAGGEAPDLLDEASRFELMGRVQSRRPDVRLPVRLGRGAGPPRAVVGTIHTLEHMPYAARMRQLFDIAVSEKSPRSASGDPELRHAPGEGDDLIDTSGWLPLLHVLYGEGIPLDHPFYGVSPERTNLAYNLISDYRREYLSVVLGGGSSTWTNPGVAAALSRLVTGRRITPRVVRRIRIGEEEVGAEAPSQPLAITPLARRRVLIGLSRVSGPGGTARALGPTLARLDQRLHGQGLELRTYSKTGSPDHTMYSPSRLCRALDDLIRIGALRLDGQRRITYRNLGPVDVDGGESSGDAAVVRSLATQPADRAILRRHRVRARSVAQVADTWNDSRPEDQRQFLIDRGRLVRALAMQPRDSIGAAYAATLVATPVGAGGGDDALPGQPRRALTLAIIIEGQGDGPHVAVPLAAQLVDEVLGSALVDGW